MATEAPIKRCACIWYSDTEPSDARTCLELRTYGYSPVMRRGSGHSEASFLEVDMEPDEACECPCHDEVEDDWSDDADE